MYFKNLSTAKFFREERIFLAKAPFVRRQILKSVKQTCLFYYLKLSQ